MPRAVAFSAKKKKAQLQLKRAVKRGDISPPPPSTTDLRWRRKGKSRVATDDPASLRGVESARRLQSSFVKLSKEYLQETQRLAAVLPIPRPLPPGAAVWNDATPSDTSTHDDPSSRRDQLTCPKRPKWRYEMTKKEVEKNEEGLFAKWLDQTDAVIGDWCSPELPKSEPTDEDIPREEEMPRAPTSFEHNLEVWRQLWRVTEISQIFLILLDSRCPLLHYPPSLASYLSAPAFARKRTILVLTKVDIAGPVRSEAWTNYLKDKYPHLRVVQVESYAEKAAGPGASGRHQYEPHLPSAFRQKLVDTLRETHAELLQPPEHPKDGQAKPWKPAVKREVDWDAVVNAHGGKVGSVVGGAAAPKPAADDAPHVPEGEDDDAEPEILTIGLIGQPNVGKSSLLNALFGVSKVAASRTPGKTKHFQTLFWTPEVRLVDCPGLVMPNFIPMETQVLCGILPISRVSATPLCVYHAARLLPLETIFELSHPSLATPPKEDKRTWRAPRNEVQMAASKPKVEWTAMDILVALAFKKGWVTAKAGRPDVKRAGNFILRCLAEGKVKWAFWPPGTDAAVIETQHAEKGTGIWIPHEAHEVSVLDVDDKEGVEAGTDDSSEDESSEGEEETPDEDVSGGEDGEPVEGVRITASRFGALAVSEDSEDGDEDMYEDEDKDENEKE